MTSPGPNAVAPRPRSLGPDQLVARAVIVIAPVLATFATFIASADWLMWVLPIVVVAAVRCAWHGESHLGLGVVIILALHWIAAVEDRTTPWLLVVVLAIAVFHTAMAMSGVAAPTARWSRTMRVRWLRRLAVVLVLTVLAWAFETWVADAGLEGSVPVFATALAVLTVAALLLRARALRPSWR